jgi:hypothetical protein
MLEFFFSLLVQIQERKASKAPKNRFSKKWKENTFFRCSASLHFGSSPGAGGEKKGGKKKGFGREAYTRPRGR